MTMNELRERRAAFKAKVLECLKNSTLSYREVGEAQRTLLGMGILVTAAVVMPWLGRRKRHLAAATSSAALKADAAESSLCGYLAWIALCGLAVNAIWHKPWADPLAAPGACSANCARRVGGRPCLAARMRLPLKMTEENPGIEAQREHWERNYASRPSMFGGEPSHAAQKSAAPFRAEGRLRILDLGGAGAGKGDADPSDASGSEAQHRNMGGAVERRSAG